MPIKHITQANLTDCGLACVAMVTGKSLERRIDLSASERSVRPRLLALAIAELVASSSLIQRSRTFAGDYVKAATSEPLVTVNQMRPILVRFSVPQADLASILRERSRNLAVRALRAGECTLALAGGAGPAAALAWARAEGESGDDVGTALRRERLALALALANEASS